MLPSRLEGLRNRSCSASAELTAGRTAQRQRIAYRYSPRPAGITNWCVRRWERRRALQHSIARGCIVQHNFRRIDSNRPCQHQQEPPWLLGAPPGMPRVDAWDVQTQHDTDISVGLPRGFNERFTFGQELGRGGFGVVRAVADAHTGEQLACKSIVKRLAVPNLSAAKQAQHLEKIKRELEVGAECLRKLRNLRHESGPWRAAGPCCMSNNQARIPAVLELQGCVWQWCHVASGM